MKPQLPTKEHAVTMQAAIQLNYRCSIYIILLFGRVFVRGFSELLLLKSCSVFVIIVFRIPVFYMVRASVPCTITQ